MRPPYGKRDPYYSHRDSYGSGMGILWVMGPIIRVLPAVYGGTWDVGRIIRGP